jgi:hypothetical protein
MDRRELIVGMLAAGVVTIECGVTMQALGYRQPSSDYITLVTSEPCFRVGDMLNIDGHHYSVVDMEDNGCVLLVEHYAGPA